MLTNLLKCAVGRKGRITLSGYPETLRQSDEIISFEASRRIKRAVDMAPNEAPTDSVATVVVVVTVEIISSQCYTICNL